MVVQSAIVLLNVILAPILIAGWGTGIPMGVAGAGLGTTISVLAGVVMMVPFLLVAGSVLIFFSRSSARRQAGVRSNSARR